MNTKNSRRNRIAAVGLGAALSLGIAAPVFAQTAATTVNPTATKTRPTPAERQAAEAARKAAFASRLGVTVAQITQADKDQAKADVDRALAAGTINAAQAGAYRTLIDNDSDGRGSRIPRVRPATGTEPTQAEREAQRAVRLKEYTVRLGVTVDAYTKAQKDQAKADVDAAVTAGRITAAQATELKARIDSSTGGFGGPGKGGPGHGGRGGHGGPGMGGGHDGHDGPGMGGRGMGKGAAVGAPTVQS